jgi:hypothetical protein
MSQPAAVRRMSYAEYLEFERSADVKHDYLRGEVFALAGGSPERSRLRGEPHPGAGCGAARAALRRVHVGCPGVRLEATDRATYPDMTVVCDRLQHAADDPDAIVNPVVIVEVLSDATEAEDRGEKFARYRRLPSLQEYVLVSQRATRIEVYRRHGDRWIFAEAGAGENLRIESIDVAVSVDEVYRDPLPASGAAGS